MRRVFSIAAAFCLAVPALAQAPSPWDGQWTVTVRCPKSDDGASAYAQQFIAHVSNGLFSGENAGPGQPGYLKLEGPIKPDGTSVLSANGLTGRLQPYSFVVPAQFQQGRGTGERTGARVCKVLFAKS